MLGAAEKLSQAHFSCAFAEVYASFFPSEGDEIHQFMDSRQEALRWFQA